jgi:hypothetical protein
LTFKDLGESFSFLDLEVGELAPAAFENVLSIVLVSGVGFSVVKIPNGDCARGWSSGCLIKGKDTATDAK